MNERIKEEHESYAMIGISHTEMVGADDVIDADDDDWLV